jgi:uncharacterized repeat protein (TIGR03803 family)
MSRKRFPRSMSRLCILFAALAALASSASAEWKEKVLYSFQGGTDGILPVGRMVFDKAGRLYGATTDGGAYTCAPTQCGTVFQLAPPAKAGDPWSETVLYIFKGNASGDGNTPAGGLVMGDSGRLYGTTAYGGTGSCVLLGGTVGCGTVYELSPPAEKGGAWTETVLYSFQSGDDGYLPSGDLVFDQAGNLYGATQYGGGGGAGNCNPFYQFCGTIFELSPPKTKGGAWTEQVLYSFKGGTDGANPNGGLLLNAEGMIFGTTQFGGNQLCQTAGGTGCGTAFALVPSRKKAGGWSERMLHRFQAGKDGAGPDGNMVWGARGNLYGTTFGGGNENGTVFRLTPPAHGDGWTEQLVHIFKSCGSQDGCSPGSGPMFDSSGNLYGTAGGGAHPGGVVFQMKPSIQGGNDWMFDVDYNFTGSPDGYGPVGLVFRESGEIYGTTQYGGTGQACSGGCGVVFEVSP